MNSVYPESQEKAKRHGGNKRGTDDLGNLLEILGTGGNFGKERGPWEEGHMNSGEGKEREVYVPCLERVEDWNEVFKKSETQGGIKGKQIEGGTSSVMFGLTSCVRERTKSSYLHVKGEGGGEYQTRLVAILLGMQCTVRKKTRRKEK